MREGATLALLGALLLGGCAQTERIAGPPEAPRLGQPSLAMPGDLDLVVRLDLGRLRDALGEDLQNAVDALLSTAPENAPDAATSRLLLALLSRAKTAWIGVRPALSPEQTDNVLVLRGDFQGLVPSRISGKPDWTYPQDLGGGVLKFSRPRPGQRVAPAVLYFQDPNLVVIGSYAELDALEATLETGRGDPPLEPPDTGIASLAARLDKLQPILRSRAPSFGKLLSGAQTIRASAAWTGSELDLRVELIVDSNDHARQIAETLGAIARKFSPPAPRQGSWIGRGSITAVERSVIVRVGVPGRELLGGLRRLSDRSPNSDGTVGAP